MKVFALTAGDRTRASSRLRVWDHLDWLRHQGHNVQVCYVMPPGVHNLTAALAWRIVRQWPVWVWNLLWADRILIQEALLLAPVLWLKRLGKRRRVVFDFSDPVDTVGAGLRNRVQRLGFALTTASADHVIIENSAYLFDLWHRGIAASQFYGPVDVDRYQANASPTPHPDIPGRPLRIGWTGSPGTLSFIEPLLPVLDRLAQRHSIELMLIGVTTLTHELEHLNVSLVPWTEETEFRLVPTFDLGLFALDGSERSKRRGAGKLFVYMAAGVPFIASSVGIAVDLMREAGVGYSVGAAEQWENVLEQAIMDASSRRRMARDGVNHAAECLSYASYRRELAAILQV